MNSSLRIVYALIVFVLGIVLLSALTVLLIYESRQTNLSFDQVNHTNVVRHSLEKVFSTLKDAESAHRGYLITGDSTFLAPYHDLDNVPADFDRIDSLVKRDPLQSANALKLRELFRQRQEALQSILNKNIVAGYQTGTEYLSDLRADYSIMNQTRQLIDQMQAHEESVLHKQQSDAKRHSILPTIIGIGISIFAIIIFILAFYFTNAELKKSNRLNDELEKKNVQLKKYAHELSSFANITSHDMQEPLRKIEVFISMIEDRETGTMSSNARQYFDKIKELVGRMRQLFFNILSFSLADQMRNVKENVRLDEVLAETLESLKFYIKDTQAVINYDHLPIVYGVKQQLIQVFQNLISNSLKYKRADTAPEISVSYEIVEGNHISSPDLNTEKKYFKINFKDNGIGFDEQYSERIFDIFQRHVRTDNGIGIGLSICKKIAQNHSGTITAESEINKGSLFSFYIPVTSED